VQSEYEKDFASAAGLANFKRLLVGAEIISLPLVRGSSNASIGAPGAARDWQYAQLGVFVSNHCQVLLALWNGKPDDQVGGTAGVVNYHLTAVMPGYRVSEESPNLLADNENDLAYQIVVRRQREGGDLEIGRKHFDQHWLTAHFEQSPPDCMPVEYREMLDRLLEFNRDVAKYAGEVVTRSSHLLEESPPIGLPGGADYVDRLFGKADWLAIHFQRRVHHSMMVIHGLAVAMGLVFILYSEYDAANWMLYLFLALFGIGFVFHAIGNRREWHRKYLDYRALAEGLRVQLYWNLAGVVDTQSAVFAYDNFLQKQDVDLGWIRHVMRSASLWRDRTQPPDPGWVQWVIGQWIGDRETGKGGQLAYYSAKSELQAARYRRTTRLGAISLWAGILIAALLAFLSGRISSDSQTVLLVLAGVLPLIAGVRDAYSHKRAERELIKQYRFMSQVFRNARSLLNGSNDLEFHRRVLKAVGNAALEEHAEWILMHRERPLEHGGL